ncbi:hypothetical protein Tco_0645353 [Tanacetum coccineum]
MMMLEECWFETLINAEDKSWTEKCWNPGGWKPFAINGRCLVTLSMAIADCDHARVPHVINTPVPYGFRLDVPDMKSYTGARFTMMANTSPPLLAVFDMC